jgi:hypothetical protein
MKVYLSLFIVCLAAVVCFAAPKPSLVPSANEWTIDVEFEHPQQIMAELPGENKICRFWYIIVNLTNHTGGEVDFYPMCELMTDSFQITPAGKGVRGGVFERIRLRHQGKYPFLESLETINHKVLQGQDNARDIAIIWPDFDPNAKEVSLFLAGLSNETAAINHPTAKDEDGRPLRVLLRKTLELKYKIGGDPVHRESQKLVFTGKRWVMR